jgi:tripartite-type tricarboxylate transporter receptor subunit TctC
VKKGTTGDIINKLNAGVRSTFANDQAMQAIKNEGAFVKVSSPDEFRVFIASEIDRWAKVTKSAGIKPD